LLLLLVLLVLQVSIVLLSALIFTRMCAKARASFAKCLDQVRPKSLSL